MHIIGRGRYAGETYPEGGGGGGGGGAIVPLSRFRFIDGGTATTGDTGAISEPYPTIGGFLSSLGAPASANDANQPFVGYVAPAIAGYSESLALPAGRNTTLAAASGITVTGDVTWANVAVANQATEAFQVFDNLFLAGNFTVTDDGAGSPGLVSLASDNFTRFAGLTGTFTANTTRNFVALTTENASMTTVDLGSAATSAFIESVLTTFFPGTITAASAIFDSCVIDSTAITVHASCEFSNTDFGLGQNCLLTTGTGTANANTFDGTSWRNFLASGGTRASGVIVLVTGGFYAAPVYGAALPVDNGSGGAATTAVCLNGDPLLASAGFTGSNSGNVYVSSGATQNNTVEVATNGGENVGDTICITKTDLAAHTLTVKNAGGTTVGVIPSGSRGSIVLVRAGATAIGGITNDWALSNPGSLAA